MRRAAIVILLLLVVVTYANTLRNDFVSDDRAGILFNKEISQFSSVLKNPESLLRSLSLFVVVKLFGRVALWFHLMNILFHAGAVIVAFFIIARLINPRVAFLASGIFAVHPLQSEAVAWISAGPYLEYSLFILLAFICYVQSENKRKYLMLSQLFFLLSLFSSSGAIVFPFVILIYAISFQDMRKVAKVVASYFLISSFWFALYLSKIGHRVDDLNASFYQKPELMNPLQQIPIAITSYLELIFWPRNFTIYHSEMTFTYFEYMVRAAIFIGLIGLLVYSFWRSRRVFFWGAFFLITLLPTLTPMGISWIVAERYAYLGSLGVYLIIALGFARLQKSKLVVNCVFACVIILLSARTVIRNSDWLNEDTLWKATAKISVSSPNAHNNLGDVYSRHRQFPEAIEEFNKAIELNPRYADAYHNLANTYLSINNLTEAAKNYQKALKYNQRLIPSYQNLATIYFLQGDFQLAQGILVEALRLDPGNFQLHNNLGILYIQTDDLEKAKEEFKKAIALEPSHPSAKKLLEAL